MAQETSLNGEFNIQIRISRDAAGNLRFTKKEVEELLQSGSSFHKNLLVRTKDGKVIGEIKKIKIS
jgi:hypothetical protein